MDVETTAETIYAIHQGFRICTPAIFAVSILLRGMLDHASKKGGQIMMQKAADALNAYLERNSTPDNRLDWTRTQDGYVLYSGVTKTHDQDGRMLSTPVHLESRIVATNAREAIAFATRDQQTGCEQRRVSRER